MPALGPRAMPYVQAAECRAARGRIEIGVGQVAHPLLSNEKAFAGQYLHKACGDPPEQGLQMLSGGPPAGMEYRDATGEAIDAIEHQAMLMNVERGARA